MTTTTKTTTPMTNEEMRETIRQMLRDWNAATPAQRAAATPDQRDTARGLVAELAATLPVGSKVMYVGYPGVVTTVHDGVLAGMITVKLASGYTCVSVLDVCERVDNQRAHR